MNLELVEQYDWINAISKKNTLCLHKGAHNKKCTKVCMQQNPNEKREPSDRHQIILSIKYTHEAIACLITEEHLSYDARFLAFILTHGPKRFKYNMGRRLTYTTYEVKEKPQDAFSNLMEKWIKIHKPSNIIIDKR